MTFVTATPDTMMTLKGLHAVLPIALLLTACGGGGSSDPEPAPTNGDAEQPRNPFGPVAEGPTEQPADDPATTADPGNDPDTIPPPTVTTFPPPDDETPPGTTTPPPTTTAPPPTTTAPPPDTTTPPPTTGAPPIAGVDVLSDLFGRATIAYSFSADPQTIFTISTTFDESNVQGGGSPLISNPNGETTIAAGGGAPQAGETVVLACQALALQTGTQFLCLSDVGGNQLTAYLFPLLTDGASEGSFAFCGTDSFENCGQALALAPSGPALLTVDGAGIAKQGDSDSSLDLLPYLQYAQQGVPAAADADDRDARLIANAMAAIGNRGDTARP